MKRIFTPLTWDESESKNDVLDRLQKINDEQIIAAVEINLPQFFRLLESNSREIRQVIKSLSKPALGMCGLESKGDGLSQSDKIELFIRALEAGFTYVDIEYTGNFQEYIERAIADFKTSVPDFDASKQLVVEYASFQQTPDFEQACIIIEEIAVYRPFLIKFITMVNASEDNDVFYRLLDKYASHLNLIAFGMGDMGIESRIATVHKGGYATYGHFGLASKACPGQIYYKDLAARFA